LIWLDLGIMAWVLWSASGAKKREPLEKNGDESILKSGRMVPHEMATLKHKPLPSLELEPHETCFLASPNSLIFDFAQSQGDYFKIQAKEIPNHCLEKGFVFQEFYVRKSQVRVVAPAVCRVFAHPHAFLRDQKNTQARARLKVENHKEVDVLDQSSSQWVKIRYLEWEGFMHRSTLENECRK
jgi:hypothetical protein